MRGWALAAEGEVAAGIADMREGLAAYRATGALLAQPHFIGLLAEACARAGEPSEALRLLVEALAIVDRMEERWFEAELHRLKGEVLLLGDAHDAGATGAACLGKAVEVARGQGARYWELRAATSLARFWAERGERARAFDLLAPVYGWFTEGFDTLDLREARVLLDALQ
jgi:predicted ATPase